MKKNQAKELQAIEDEIKLIHANINLKAVKSTTQRARSVTVGTCFGGVTEVIVRGDAGEFLWCPLQPVEAIELIHQLAASVGCHINLQPRDDFSSWREWRAVEDKTAQLSNGIGNSTNSNIGYSDTEDPASDLGAVLPHPDKQPGMVINRSINNDVVATEKTVNRRSIKRAAKTS